MPHTFLGFLFGIDDSTVCRSNRQLEPLLAGVFRIPEQRIELTPEDRRALVVDSTERPIGRPVRSQKRFYSGKKKRHTLKVQVVAVRPASGAGRGGAGGS